MRLPLFIENSEPIFILLAQLIEDESEYMRRSVANNLNDISKDHPEKVVSWLQSMKRQYPVQLRCQS